MTLDFWIIMEWSSVILALLGTILASTFKGKYMKTAFSCWIIGAILTIIFHQFHSEKYGLLLLGVISLVISSFGMYNTIKNNKSEEVGDVLNSTQKLLIGGGILSFITGLLFFGYYFIAPGQDVWYKSSVFELGTAFINIIGLTLISSNSKYSKYCWFFWSISNLLFMGITYCLQYYGIMFQQIVFTLLNIWGILNWFVLKKDAIKAE